MPKNSKFGAKEAKTALLIGGVSIAIAGGGYIIYKALKPLGKTGENAGEIAKNISEIIKDVTGGISKGAEKLIEAPDTLPQPEEYKPENRNMRLTIISQTTTPEAPAWKKIILPIAAAMNQRKATVELRDSATNAPIMGAKISADFSMNVLQRIMPAFNITTNTAGRATITWGGFRGKADNVQFTARKEGYNPQSVFIS